MFKIITAAATLALAAPALAQEVPTPITLGFSAKRGSFEGNGDSDFFSVRLLQGNDYAVGALATNSVAILRDPGGREVGRAGLGPDETLGFEVRAPVTGRYVLELKNQSAPGDNIDPNYLVRITSDCRAGPTTKCQLRPGNFQQRNTASAADVNWFKLQLKARNYRVRIPNASGLALAIVNRSGQVLAQSANDYANPVTVTFRPPAAGTFYARVSEVDDDGEVYRIVLELR